jgi:CRISPR-associated endonuclease Csn1
MEVREDLTLGIDLGIGSCGWALIRPGEIVALGVRTFDPPETDKERTPTNQLRRGHRGLRRVLRRRRKRMADLRRLFAEAGLMGGAGRDVLRVPGLDPWRLRAEGLDRRLNGPELTVALAHIAKHRGFKSNRKSERGANAAEESSKMLKAIGETQEKLTKWRTVGEMFARDAAFAGRKRNRDGEYSRSILRDDQAVEVRELFRAQRRLGNDAATEELEGRFGGIAFHQKELQDSEHLVGPCRFVEGQKRAARRSYSFELFRFLSRLAALRLEIDGKAQPEPLTPEQIARARTHFGKQKKVRYKELKKLLGLGSDTRFAGIAPGMEGNDFVARSGNAAEGTATLRAIVQASAGELAWLTLLDAPEKLDRIAAVLSFREDIGSIAKGFDELGLAPEVRVALMDAVEAGKFRAFSKTGHISTEACRRLIPHLADGLTYDKACDKVFGEHTVSGGPKLQGLGLHAAVKKMVAWIADEIGSPVARKALTEAAKQVGAIIGEHGLPGHIHVELAREVGKSKEERDEITHGIEKRNKEKDRLRAAFLADVGQEARTADDLLRYELWREQLGRCIYTDQAISPTALVASDNSVEVDHILPWSRSGDDSFVNKTLCFTSANREKKHWTPFRWMEGHQDRWSALVARVENNKLMKGRKKRNYLLKDDSVLEEKFRPRNLQDTKYATRVLLGLLKGLYPDGGEQRVLSRPGPLTDRLRRGWGIQGLKKGPDGKRIADDRHHAIDALIVAATSQAELQKLIIRFQEAEALGSHRDFSRLDPPWPEFRTQAEAMFDGIFISRAERRRARGEGHAATIRSIVERDGQSIVYERKRVDKSLTLADLNRIKDPERNQALIAALQAWIEADKPADKPPLKRFGGRNSDGVEKESERFEPIRKVTLRTNKKVDVLVRDGAADRGEMVRIDVFRKRNRKGAWEYFLVPIYPHQVFDTEDWPEPPNRIVRGAKPESEWPEIDGDHEFLWSLYPLCWLELEKADGTAIKGYFRRMDRSTGAITLSPHHSKDEEIRSIGCQTLRSFRKFAVDRLGRKFEIERETRTWRGKACT